MALGKVPKGDASTLSAPLQSGKVGSSSSYSSASIVELLADFHLETVERKSVIHLDKVYYLKNRVHKFKLTWTMIPLLVASIQKHFNKNLPSAWFISTFSADV
jgi:hypothetical protein